MGATEINRASRRAMIALSLTALGTVVTGYFQAPLSDEGTAAHIFQLSIVMLAPSLLLYLATADRKQPLQVARQIAAPAVATVLAFALLYHLEHYFYPEHYK